MKNTAKIMLVCLTCLSLFCGCSLQVPNDSNLDNNSENVTEEKNNEASASQGYNTNKNNIFYPSSTTEKERFYINVSESGFIPFELSSEDKYNNLSCKLYELKNGNWNNLKQTDIKLSGNTFWFLISRFLLNTKIKYKNVNPTSKSIDFEGTILFDEIQTDFNCLEINTYSNITEEIEVEDGKEFPVIANIFWKSNDVEKNLTSNTNDFYHPEDIELKDDEAYYMLTFTFSK